MQHSEQTTSPLIASVAAKAVDETRAIGRLGWWVRVWKLSVVALVSVNMALAIWYLIRTGDDTIFFTHQLFLPFLAISYTYLGSITISHRPKNPIGWMFLCIGAFYVLTGLTASIIDGALPPILTPLALLDMAYWLGNWSWLPAQILPLTFVFLLFPDGHLPSIRWRLIGWSAGLGLLLLILVLALHPGPISDFGTKPNPYGIIGAENYLNTILMVGSTLLAVGLLGSVLAVIARFRRSRGTERAQMKWLVYAAFVILLVGVFTIPLWLTGNLAEALAMEISIILTNLMTLGIAGAATIAIVRYRLYDIDVIINRTLVYTVMTGVILLIYGLIVGAVGILFELQGNWLLAVLATGMVAVLFQPIQNRLKRGVNRLLYGQRDEPFEVMTRLGQRLEQTISPELAYPTIVETVAQAMRLPYVAIQLPFSDGIKTVESYGIPVGEPVAYELKHQGEAVGWLQVSRRAPAEPFNSADEGLLRNIARQAGTAVRNAQLTTDLQTSRQQIVTSREEERRRLRRDLHDGLGPSLASLLLEARVLRRLIRDDPTAAEDLADEMQGDIRATIDDIRRVVNELRPPALDDLGLVPAIQVMADKFGHAASGTAVEPVVQVDAPDDLPLLPAAVEVATYRIVQEALANVAQHARARYACVRLRFDQELHVEITDDGVGFSGGRDGGIGLRSMRERAAEIGGSLLVSRRPEGGTLVQAVLPVSGV